MMPEFCEIPGCPNPAMVGWGQTPTWLCLYHFEAALADTREKMDALLQMPRPPSQGD